MKRSCASPLLLGALAAMAAGQTFTKVAPLPATADLSGVAFPIQNLGFVSGTGHTLVRTRDGGLTWQPISLPGYPDGPFYAVHFVDTQVGFVSGNSADGSRDIFRTADGGETWNRVDGFPLGGSWYYIDFVDANTGFMGCNGALVRTTDRGLSWPIMSGYPDCPVIYGMDFRDATTGMVGGHHIPSNRSGLWKTTDGGRAWTLKHPSGGNDVVYLNSSTLLADDGMFILRSTDGGETWNRTPAFLHTGLMDMDAVTPSRVAGVSGGGDIWMSEDGGQTFNLVWMGEGDLPAMWTVKFRDALNGHVVGQGGLMYETYDGGRTWARTHRGVAREWNALAAFGDRKVVLVGHHGYIQRTEDLGRHWDIALLDPPTFERDTGFQCISNVGDFAVAAGAWGGMFRTRDAGRTWEDLRGVLSVDYYVNGIKFVDENNGWVVGFDYTPGFKKYVQRTRGGGDTWETVDGANIPSVDVDFRGQRGWILTSSEPFWRTQDGGATWTMTFLPDNSGSPPNCADMDWVDANTGYACGWDGYVIKTTDGGATWRQLGATQYNFVYLGVETYGPNEVWICGARRGGGGAVVKRSTDGGTTWRTWNLPGQWTTPYRMVHTPLHLYAAGYNGEVWRFDGLGVVPVRGQPF